MVSSFKLMYVQFHQSSLAVWRYADIDGIFVNDHWDFPPKKAIRISWHLQRKIIGVVPLVFLKQQETQTYWEVRLWSVVSCFWYVCVYYNFTIYIFAFYIEIVICLAPTCDLFIIFLPAFSCIYFTLYFVFIYALHFWFCTVPWDCCGRQLKNLLINKLYDPFLIGSEDFLFCF